jgi:hypothetical protein
MTSKPGKLLETALVGAVNPVTGKFALIRVLLDPGSQVNLIDRKVAKDLGLTLTERDTPLRIKMIGATSEPESCMAHLLIKHRTQDQVADTEVEAVLMDTTNWTVHSQSG